MFTKITLTLSLAFVATFTNLSLAQELDNPAAEEHAAVQTVSYGCAATGCCEVGCCEETCSDPSCCAPECGDTGCCDCCGESGCCCGRDVCVATVEKEKVEKHCWKVECEKICVPKVVCPWGEGGSGLTLFSWMKKKSCNSKCGDACCSDACCDCGKGCCNGGCDCCCVKPRCGKVKCVRDIKKEKYECEECVCKWEVRRLPCCDCGGCAGACDCGSTCR